MTDVQLHKVPEYIKNDTHITEADYQSLYAQSMNEPEKFWAEKANEFLTWQSPFSDKPSDIMNYDFHKGDISWFKGGKLNISENCIDRHLATRADQVAIIWEGDEPNQEKHITYRMLHKSVCQMANVLKQRGVKKGDRVAIYMPMIPEAAYAMLACARIGAVHSVVFGGFSPTALRDRINDASCEVVITADEGPRGAKNIPLKVNVDSAINECPDVHSVIVVQRTGNDIAMQQGRDIWYHEAIKTVEDTCPAEPMDSEDPLFILYTSGSTGKPKGVLHTTAGYLLYAAITHKYTFDYREGDVYWCTADVGWVTGHSYIVYGPLANGAISLMFEGVPTYPDASRFWQVVDKHKVNIFYTAPTAIRALMGQGDEFVKSTNRSSLRILGSVGEPINPEAWEWYHKVVGKGKCPIVDTWWQTETGGFLITPLPGATDLKPGSATRPFFGIEPVLVDAEANEVDGETAGNLVIKRSWPGQMRTIFGDHKRFIETYFSTYPGYFTSGDGAKRDKDGYFWITGRTDDVINVSGHRLGTAEIESALVLHKSVAESAVVGFEHDVKGQGIYAFVTLMAGVEESDELKVELNALVRQEIGPIAKIDHIQWAPGLPKTRSGKIMRRILRKVASNDTDNMGDISTLAEPAVVEELISRRSHS